MFKDRINDHIMADILECSKNHDLIDGISRLAWGRGHRDSLPIHIHFSILYSK